MTFLTIFCSSLVPPGKTKKIHMGLIFHVESNSEVRFKKEQKLFAPQKTGVKSAFLDHFRHTLELEFTQNKNANLFLDAKG